MPTFKPKACERCENDFIPTGSRSQYCDACRAIVTAEKEARPAETVNAARGAIEGLCTVADEVPINVSKSAQPLTLQFAVTLRFGRGL